jgi:hypothetical protein
MPNIFGHAPDADFIAKLKARLKRVAGGLMSSPIPSCLLRFAAALAAEVHSKTLLIEKLRMQLAVLRRARFGRSSEKLDREIEQLELLLGDIEESDAERQARTRAFDGEALTPSSPAPKKPSVRAPLCSAEGTTPRKVFPPASPR